MRSALIYSQMRPLFFSLYRELLVINLVELRCFPQNTFRDFYDTSLIKIKRSRLDVSRRIGKKNKFLFAEVSILAKLLLSREMEAEGIIVSCKQEE